MPTWTQNRWADHCLKNAGPLFPGGLNPVLSESTYLVYRYPSELPTERGHHHCDGLYSPRLESWVRSHDQTLIGEDRGPTLVVTTFVSFQSGQWPALGFLLADNEVRVNTSREVVSMTERALDVRTITFDTERQLRWESDHWLDQDSWNSVRRLNWLWEYAWRVAVEETPDVSTPLWDHFHGYRPQDWMEQWWWEEPDRLDRAVIDLFRRLRRTDLVRLVEEWFRLDPYEDSLTWSSGEEVRLADRIQAVSELRAVLTGVVDSPPEVSFLDRIRLLLEPTHSELLAQVDDLESQITTLRAQAAPLKRELVERFSEQIQEDEAPLFTVEALVEAVEPAL